MRVATHHNEAPSSGEMNPPMDDASFGLPNSNEMASAPAAPDAPMSDNVIPQMPSDAGMEMPQTDAAPVEDDSTMGIINQLSDTDKKAVRAYAESMLKKSKEAEDEGGAGQMNQMESVCLTKAELNEAFGIEELEPSKSENKIEKRKEIKIQNSPFNSPKFE